jgi:hypothetical protein
VKRFRSTETRDLIVLALYGGWAAYIWYVAGTVFT